MDDQDWRVWGLGLLRFGDAAVVCVCVCVCVYWVPVE